MPTSVLIAVVLSVLLGVLVFGLSSRATAPSASTAAGQKHVDFPQVHWNINSGSGAYLTMLDQLRNLAETSANARVVPNINTSRGQRVNVVVTDNTETQSFADVVISGGNGTPTVHAIVRLSDFCVVRFFTTGTPHHFVLNLASDVPGREDATDDNWFLGKEGYDALARVANQSLTEVNLSRSSLENSLRDLGIRGTDRAAQARGMLRYIIAIAEASRFRPIANRIADGMDNASNVFVTSQQVGLMRNWAGISHVFIGRTNRTDLSASTRVAGATIADVRVAADLLAVALNDGPNPNKKDEL